MKTIKILWAMLFSIALASCGGGGGSANPPATPTYSISGTVSGAVQQGVTINLSGNSTATTTTDASGNYSFTGLSGTGNYTVTPAKTGYVFSSISSAVSMSGANVTGTNFTATANTAATYSISGKVSGHSPYIEMITLSGSMSGTTFTDWEGNFNFSGLVNGSYTVTPSFIGSAQSTGFSPSITTVSVNSANVPNTNFTATYTLSGKVSGILSGVGLQGVTINLTGPVTANTTTDANGNYTISGLPIGDYTVVPSLSGYSFGPAGSVVSVYSGMAPPNRDFYATVAAATYSISGTVSGAISQYVKITLSGANIGSVLTDASGNYIFSGLVNGNYTVTPSLAGYAFSPANSAVTINGANATAINFVAAVSYRISGSVMVSGAALQGVTITLTGATNASTTTDMMGGYFFDGLANGSYSVTPSLAGYSFTPVSSAVTINGANSTGNYFVAVAAPVSYSISGTVSGAVLQGVTVNLTGAANASTTTDASGNYSFSGLTNGSYTVTPSLVGYTFNPANSAVTIVGMNSAANNFVSAAAPGTYSISGTVSGAVLQGVMINLTGAATASSTTDVSGNYSFSGLTNGSYTVTPSLTGYSFSPTNRAVTISSANSTANNFTSSASVVYSFSYYKRSGTTTPQTATLTNGTLSIDGIAITGVSYSVGTCLTGGTGTVLTSCFSPPDAPHTMLLCGPDPVTAAPGTLLYVLFDSPDANTVSATSTSLLNALQSEINYLGTSVYTDCSGSAYTSWIRNYPNTNYYLWPNVIATYTSTYVTNLLSGAVIFSTPIAGNNYKQFVAVRVSGTVFEVWH